MPSNPKHPFKIGDLVKCVNAGFSVTLEKGTTYKVLLAYYSENHPFVKVLPRDLTNGGWYANRFVLVKAGKAVKPKRAYWKTPKGKRYA